jgi:hypothetical protein
MSSATENLIKREEEVNWLIRYGSGGGKLTHVQLIVD